MGPAGRLRAKHLLGGDLLVVHMPDDPKVTLARGTSLLLEVVILAQVFRFGRADFEHQVVRTYTTPILGLAFATTVPILMGFTAQFGNRPGWFTGFFQNLRKSVLFVAMPVRRQSVHGQSLNIALGTFVAFRRPIHWTPLDTAVVDHHLRAPGPNPAMIPLGLSVHFVLRRSLRLARLRAVLRRGRRFSTGAVAFRFSSTPGGRRGPVTGQMAARPEPRATAPGFGPKPRRPGR
jgi:hypothetical protein